MEMFGRSAASYLARTPRIPLFVLILIGLETKNVLDYQGRAGSTSIVQWTLRPVTFGVDQGCFFFEIIFAFKGLLFLKIHKGPGRTKILPVVNCYA